MQCVYLTKRKQQKALEIFVKFGCFPIEDIISKASRGKSTQEPLLEMVHGQSFLLVCLFYKMLSLKSMILQPYHVKLCTRRLLMSDKRIDYACFCLDTQLLILSQNSNRHLFQGALSCIAFCVDVANFWLPLFAPIDIYFYFVSLPSLFQHRLSE